MHRPPQNSVGEINKLLKLPRLDSVATCVFGFFKWNIILDFKKIHSCKWVKWEMNWTSLAHSRKHLKILMSCLFVCFVLFTAQISGLEATDRVMFCCNTQPHSKAIHKHIFTVPSCKTEENLNNARKAPVKRLSFLLWNNAHKVKYLLVHTCRYIFCSNLETLQLISHIWVEDHK